MKCPSTAGRTRTGPTAKAFSTFSLVLLETLETDGLPESVFPLAFVEMGLGDAKDGEDVTCLLIFAGLLRRVAGPRLVPGPEFDRTKASAESARERRRTR